MQYNNDPYQEFHDLQTAPPVSADEYESQWDFLRATSLYHFDPTREDQRIGSFPNPLYIPLLRFAGDWQEDLDRAIQDAKIFTPVNHSPTVRNVMEKNDYQRWGYTSQESYTPLFRLADAYVGMFQKMADFFCLGEPLQVRCDIQYPGQAFYYHVDNFGRMLENQRGNYESFAPGDHDQRRMMRIIVLLTDQDFGHVWHQGNLSLRWRRGDCFTYPWRDVPHGTANFGHSVRAALNITGPVTEKTWARLKDLPRTVDLSKIS